MLISRIPKVGKYIFIYETVIEGSVAIAAAPLKITMDYGMIFFKIGILRIR